MPMKHNIFNLLVFSLLSIFISTCNLPNCTNINPIFDKYSPDTKQYKDELVNQLKLVDNSKLHYWFEKYKEKEGQEYLYFHIQGDGLCAKIVLSVKQWNKIEELRERKGVTFRGAEFVNLKFDIQQDSLDTEFIYRNFLYIID